MIRRNIRICQLSRSFCRRMPSRVPLLARKRLLRSYITLRWTTSWVSLSCQCLPCPSRRVLICRTCRGTLGLSDVLIDLTCEYCEVKLDGADPQKEYYAHSGMYRSALSLTSKRSTVHEALSRALEQNPAYGLVVTGHSLGGGVAGLLSIACSMPAKSFIEQNALKPSPIQHPPISTPFVTSFSSGLPPGRPIHCYTYGVPAIASSDLAEYSKGLISSVIHNEDVVPCLSLGVLRDLKNVALTLFEEGNVAEEIVGRVSCPHV